MFRIVEAAGLEPQRSWTGSAAQRTVGRIGILARHGMLASFSGPLLHNHDQVAHASIAGDSGKK